MSFHHHDLLIFQYPKRNTFDKTTQVSYCHNTQLVIILQLKASTLFLSQNAALPQWCYCCAKRQKLKFQEKATGYLVINGAIWR